MIKVKGTGCDWQMTCHIVSVPMSQEVRGSSVDTTRVFWCDVRNYFAQGLSGVLQWICELGSENTVAMLLRCLMSSDGDLRRGPKMGTLRPGFTCLCLLEATLQVMMYYGFWWRRTSLDMMYLIPEASVTGLSNTQARVKLLRHRHPSCGST